MQLRQIAEDGATGDYADFWFDEHHASFPVSTPFRACLKNALIVTDQEYAHPQSPDGYHLPNHERLKARDVTFNNFQATTT